MKFIQGTPETWLLTIVLAGIAATILTFAFHAISSKIRRMKLKRSRCTCRLCGYRFLVSDAERTCPHCSARNA
ncbi:hypothetical protein [Akkermansia glycaniphila]|uniref:Rubredoxin-type fold n=1 Tax=Akkermansia glycaniphila TaxID=1679444 RepID=A0A1H6MEG7_9BACT|nr:hypothetical protein [Akkermansia glycaniphila]SEH96610.1 rubredoxin-type fold [Akkermansia glycaniphila]